MAVVCPFQLVLNQNPRSIGRVVGTSASTTVVTNAASVDADAGSIRYVATVIDAPVVRTGVDYIFQVSGRE